MSEIIAIGFKAEMDDKVALINAKNMLEKKNLDGVCLNILENKDSFGTNKNDIELILKENTYKFSGEKLEISLDILKTLEGEFDNHG